MRRRGEAIWPTSRRKRQERRGYRPPVYEELELTPDEMAAEVVGRGLASTAILGPVRAPRRERDAE